MLALKSASESEGGKTLLSQRPLLSSVLPLPPGTRQEEGLSSFNWSSDETPAVLHKQLSSLTPEINHYSLSPTQQITRPLPRSPPAAFPALENMATLPPAP